MDEFPGDNVMESAMLTLILLLVFLAGWILFSTGDL